MKYTLIGVLCCAVIHSYAQDKQLFSSAGMNTSAASYNIDFAIGEVCVGYFSTANYTLSEGLLPMMQDTPTLQPDMETYMFSVMPNPVENIVDIKGLKPSDKSIIIVYDLLGNELIRKKFNTSAISLAHLQTGEYILLITEGSKKYSVKIVKK